MLGSLPSKSSHTLVDGRSALKRAATFPTTSGNVFMGDSLASHTSRRGNHVGSTNYAVRRRIDYRYHSAYTHSYVEIGVGGLTSTSMLDIDNRRCFYVV